MFRNHLRMLLNCSSASGNPGWGPRFHISNYLWEMLLPLIPDILFVRELAEGSLEAVVAQRRYLLPSGVFLEKVVPDGSWWVRLRGER